MSNQTYQNDFDTYRDAPLYWSVDQSFDYRGCEWDVLDGIHDG